jgi:hypothetical protein
MREVRKEANLPVQVRQIIQPFKSQEYPEGFINNEENRMDVAEGGIIEKGKLEYSHEATFHGIPCYFNVETEGITGRGKFNCLLMDILIFIGRFIPGIGRMSKIVIGAELDKYDLHH